MFRNSHNSRGSSTNAGNSHPRWRTVFIALMLVFIIGSVGQMPQAQAASLLRDTVEFDLFVAPEKVPKLCTGQKFTFYVSLEKTVNKKINGKDYEIPGHVPEGTLDATGKIVSGPGTILAALNDGDSQAEFYFSSKNAGETTITFKALIKSSMIGANEKVMINSVQAAKTVKIKIVNCKYKATTLGVWNVPGEAHIHVAATSGDANLKATDPDGPLTGSTNVDIVLSTAAVQDCDGQSVTTSSKVDFDGQLDDNEQLTMNAKYQSADITLPVHCVGSDGGTINKSQSFQLTPDPLQISIASSGGVLTQSQILQGPEATPGQVTIIVFPEEDAATAFIPSDHAVRWNDYSSLFALLLALR